MTEKITNHYPAITWIADNDLSKSLHAATWLETTKTLRELGWKVNLVSPGEVDEEKAIRDVAVLFFSKPEVFFIQQILYHWKIFRWMLQNQDQHQVVMFHEMSAIWTLLFSWYEKLFSRKKFTFVMDTRTLPMEPEATLTLRAKLRRAYLNFIDHKTMNWFTGRMAITPAMAEVLEIPSDKLWAVWPSGVKPEIFETCSVNRKYPSENEPIKLIYIGCMHVERNLLTMSKAIVAANQSGLNFQLVLVGDGNQFDELQAYADDHPEAILIHGPVPQLEIPGWLAGAHIGILPFPDEEKFRVSSPIKLFEYMAAGMPIMATKIRCHTDVIAENADYIFWAHGSDETALSGVLKEISIKKAELQSMGKHSLDSIQYWTWPASARKISEGLLKHLEIGKDILR